MGGYADIPLPARGKSFAMPAGRRKVLMIEDLDRDGAVGSRFGRAAAGHEDGTGAQLSILRACELPTTPDDNARLLLINADRPSDKPAPRGHAFSAATTRYCTSTHEFRRSRVPTNSGTRVPEARDGPAADECAELATAVATRFASGEPDYGRT